MSSLQSLFSLYKQERVTKYQRGIAKVTDVEIDKWVEESVNVGKEKGEPSVRRSPRPMKRVNYAEMDGSDEENYFAKISLNKRV
ncbi:hypothetical protein RirG_206670 [Rhizophagus irregularis DAOM 197198w]|nr:hypothetical protein RirG_206670 [Rhizophagus irregularis DAOM 197198w]